MGTRLGLVALSGLALVMSGCAEGPPSAPPPPPPPVAKKAETIANPPVAGPEWTLTTLRGQAVPAGVTPTLSIDNGQATGSTGCNRYTAPVTLAGSNIAFGAGVSTKIACAEAAMAVETAFLAMLPTARIATTDGPVLVLYTSGGEAVARFVTRPAGG